MFAGNIYSGEIVGNLKREGKVVNIDNICSDPQLCATYACDIYKHLRESEVTLRFFTVKIMICVSYLLHGIHDLLLSSLLAGQMFAINS